MSPDAARAAPASGGTGATDGASAAHKVSEMCAYQWSQYVSSAQCAQLALLNSVAQLVAVGVRLTRCKLA
jgi:hypothetical protein